jgi:hypothetical protein
MERIETKEQCIFKKIVKSNVQITSLDKEKENCIYCNGYNNRCHDYTIIKEDCFGL